MVVLNRCLGSGEIGWPAMMGKSLERASLGASVARAPHLSVIVPIYNEEQNILILTKALFDVLDRMRVGFEVICVNDGSKDASLTKLREVAAKRRELKIIDFRRNYGQTAALMAGIDNAAGDILVSIDADMQNDPEDIPLLIAKIEEGNDVVSGWRRDRKDAPIRRNFLSRVANFLISRISGVHLNDYGCTLKAYRRDVIQGVRLYGEMHRFIPIYASWMGATVTQIPVRHHQRKFGKSNYGLERIIKVLLDLIVVKFLDKYFVQPIYVFGTFGIICIFFGMLSGLYALFLRFFEGTSLIQTPMPLLCIFLLSIGVMSILLGLIAELLVRTYFESQARSAYLVRRRYNFDESE